MSERITENRRLSWAAKNHRRRAARKGLTVEQYVAILNDKQRRREEKEERHYEKLEVKAKREDMAEEIEMERKRAASIAMLRRYHADPTNWSVAKKRRRLFERDAWQCRACGTKVTDQVHAHHPKRAVAGHIVARATGGEWTDENIATLCYPCNVEDGVNRLPIPTTLQIF